MYLTNPGIAVALVQAERHRRGDWTDLTPQQLRGIDQVIDQDGRGLLTRDDIIAGLHKIAAER